MRRLFNEAVIIPLINLTIIAWGHYLLTDGQARAINTALIRIGLLGYRRGQEDE